MLLTIDFAVIVILTTVVRAAALKLQITPPVENSVKPRGSSALFICLASNVNEDRVSVQWHDPLRRRISDDAAKRIYVEQINSLSVKLYITSIQEADAGKYVCTAGSQTKSVELIYSKDITIDHAPSPQHPKFNATAVIECRVSSSSTAPEISWRYNGKPLRTGGRYTKVRDGLQIRDMTSADDGNYTCQAEVPNDGLVKQTIITVVVHTPPRIVTRLDTIEEVEGREVTMSCRANGVPPPKYEFIKGGTNGEVLSSKDHIHIDADEGRITFRPLKRADDGMYTCRAVNDAGNDSRTGLLIVNVRPNITELNNITRSESDTGTLVCRASGHPLPEMYFQKEGNRFPYKNGVNEDRRIYISNKSNRFFGHLELTISNLSASDATNYTCLARNSVGQANKTGFIDVHFRPRIGDDKRTAHGWAGTRHNISCDVLAQPTPDIKWIRHDRQLADNDTYHIFYSGKQSNLQVRIKETDQSWIYGEYVCQANNSKGTTRARFHLNRATVPDRPMRVSNVEVTPNQVILRIEPPRENGGINVTGYQVEFENNVQDILVAAEVTQEPLEIVSDDRRTYRNNMFGQFSPNRYPSTEVSVDNLRPGTRYIFRVRAKNEVGFGGSLEHMVVTANLTKPYPVKLTSPSEGVYARHYDITWATPKTGGQPIRSYEFRYRKLKSPRSEKSSAKAESWISYTEDDNPESPIRKYRLKGLEPSTEYQLEVIARNELGASLPNEQFVFVTSDFDFRSSAVLSFGGRVLSSVQFATLLSLLVSTFAAK